MSKPVSILFTIPNFMTAGSGHAMLSVVKRLDRHRYTPSICVLKKGGKLCQEAEDLGIQVIEAPFTISIKPYTTFLFRAWKAARFFKKYNFKLWHSFHYSDDYSEPIIARLSGAARWIYTKKNMSWGSRGWEVRTFLASGIAVQNTAMKGLFFKKTNKSLEYIPPGVDTEVFYPKKQNAALKQKLGLGSSDILMGHCAHFVPVKNHPYLIRALALCPPKIHLALAGRFQEGPYLSEIKSLIQELGVSRRVHFLGEINNIADFLHSIDFFVFCSHQEACPVAVLEAMASGLACVVTDIPGIRDMHIHEETALIFSPNDPQGFALGIGQLADSEDLRDRLGQAAAERIRKYFSLDLEVSRHENFYKNFFVKLKTARFKKVMFVP